MGLAGVTVGFQGCAEKASQTQQKTGASESSPGVTDTESREDEQLGSNSAITGLDEKIDRPLDTHLPSVEPGFASSDPNLSSKISEINVGLAESVSGLNEAQKVEESSISPLSAVEVQGMEETDVELNRLDCSSAILDCNHMNDKPDDILNEEEGEEQRQAVATPAASTDQGVSDNDGTENSIHEDVTVAVSSNSEVSDITTQVEEIVENNDSESEIQQDEEFALLPSSTGGSAADGNVEGGQNEVQIQDDENTENVANEESMKVERQQAEIVIAAPQAPQGSPLSPPVIEVIKSAVSLFHEIPMNEVDSKRSFSPELTQVIEEELGDAHAGASGEGNIDESRYENSVNESIKIEQQPSVVIQQIEAKKDATSLLNEIHNFHGAKSLRKAPPQEPKTVVVEELSTRDLIDYVKANKMVEVEEDTEAWDEFEKSDSEPVIGPIYGSSSDLELSTRRVSSERSGSDLGTNTEWLSKLKTVTNK